MPHSNSPNKNSITKSIKSIFLPTLKDVRTKFTFNKIALVFLINLSMLPIVIFLGSIAMQLTVGSSNYLSASSEKNIMAFALDAVLIMPIIEEIIFRGWMTNNRFIFTISWMVMSVILVTSLIPIKSILIPIIVVSIVLALSVPIQKYVLKHFTLFFYLTTIGFALLHITNFTNLNKDLNILSYLVITSPQLLAGFVFATIRNKLGLGYSMLSHIFNNGIILTLGVLLS